MTLQENIQKKAEEYRHFAPVFLDGAKFALENQWISVDDDLPCNHKELLEDDNHTTKMLVRMRHDKYKICIMGNKEGSVDTGWHWRSSDYVYITHWMPIPKLPKE